LKAFDLSDALSSKVAGCGTSLSTNLKVLHRHDSRNLKPLLHKALKKCIDAEAKKAGSDDMLDENPPGMNAEGRTT